MQNQVDKPIFVVGSPRSGTSILAWCLGQHPNIITLPESGWMGDFAIDLAIRYQMGAARGDRSVLSAMDIQSDEFFASFGQTINQLIQRHRKDLERKRSGAVHTSSGGTASIVEKLRSKSEPQKRWVDGTPEYSFHICGLRKLFPKALFIHLVRDVRSVVRSMLNFHRVAGVHLVANEEEAYQYWLRTVSVCLKAERAYGPCVVYRLRHAALIDDPESALRSLLDFLGEPYTAKCLEPLAQRINSSNVPPDFKTEDLATDPTVIEKATRLCAEIEETPQPPEASSTAVEEMETAFEERVRYVATLDDEYYKALQEMTRLQEIIAGLQDDPRVQDPNATAN